MKITDATFIKKEVGKVLRSRQGPLKLSPNYPG